MSSNRWLSWALKWRPNTGGSIAPGSTSWCGGRLAFASEEGGLASTDGCAEGRDSDSACIANLGRLLAGPGDAAACESDEPDEPDEVRGDNASSSALAAERFDPADGEWGDRRGRSPADSGDELAWEAGVSRLSETGIRNHMRSYRSAPRDGSRDRRSDGAPRCRGEPARCRQRRLIAERAALDYFLSRPPCAAQSKSFTPAMPSAPATSCVSRRL